MPRTLAPTKLNHDLDQWLEDKKAETGSSYSQIARDALRAAMEKDKRKNKWGIY